MRNLLRDRLPSRIIHECRRILAISRITVRQDSGTALIRIRIVVREQYVRSMVFRCHEIKEIQAKKDEGGYTPNYPA